MNEQTVMYIVRHGESEGNKKGLLLGHTDSVLTKNGESQARKVCGEFKTIKFDAVLSSDLKRAVKTADILNLNKAIKIQKVQALRERYFGSLDGEPVEKLEIHFKDELQRLTTLPNEEKMNFKLVPDMETGNETAKRFISFLEKCYLKYKGKTILIVTHSSLMGNFLTYLTKRDYKGPTGAGGFEYLSYIKILMNKNKIKITETKGIS